MRTARLSRTRRLSGERSFARVFDARCSASNGMLVVYAAANGLSHARLGLSVGRRFGAAVARNRIKRLIREAFRRDGASWAGGYDLVCVPRAGVMYELADLLKSLPSVGRRAIQRFKATYEGP